MARRNVHSGPTLADNPAAGDGLPPKDTRWFVELLEVTEPLSLTGERAFYVIGVILLGSFGIAYWGAYTEHLYVAGAAVVVFVVGIAAWSIVTCWRLWAVLKGGIEWWRNRRRDAISS